MTDFELGSNEVMCQKWEESERGWNTRPDGFSLHTSYQKLRAFIGQYWDSMPDVAPSEYSRPDGSPYPIGVSDEVFEALQESEFGIRFRGIDIPGSGGTDGWLRRIGTIE
jgi:hypothetical protein